MLYALRNTIKSPHAFETAMNDLRQIIVQRIQSHFNQTSFVFDDWIEENFKGNLFNQDILNHIPQLKTIDEWIVLMLAMLPHVQPSFFESIIAEHLPNGGDFPEFGGVKGTNHRGILPTGETAQFILAGENMEKRIDVQRILSSDHWFAKNHIRWLEPVREGEPVMSGRLVLDPELVEQLTIGTVSRPRFSSEFPAE